MNISGKEPSISSIILVDEYSCFGAVNKSPFTERDFSFYFNSPHLVKAFAFFFFFSENKVKEEMHCQILSGNDL